jgi:hypothetical protein
MSSLGFFLPKQVFYHFSNTVDSNTTQWVNVCPHFYLIILFWNGKIQTWLDITPKGSSICILTDLVKWISNICTAVRLEVLMTTEITVFRDVIHCCLVDKPWRWRQQFLQYAGEYIPVYICHISEDSKAQ